MKLLSAIVIVALGILFSCVLFLPGLEIISWSPGNEATADIKDLVILVSFNRRPSAILTEEAFSISREGEELSGRISWLEKSMIFTPYSQLEGNSEYIMKIDKSAEDSNGGSLTEDFIVSFRTGPVDVRPAIQTVSPVDGSFVNDEYPDIFITFDLSMDFNSILSAFSIVPKLKGVSSLDAAKQVFRFSPSEALELQEEYTVTISDTATSLNGYCLLDEYKFSFTISDDKTPPEISEASSTDDSIVLSDTIVNTGWEKDDAVRIKFSEEINRRSAEAAVTIEPAAPFEVSFDESETPCDMIISFSENLQWRVMYKITLSTALKDQADNRLESDISYRLFVNGESSAPPLLVKADFISDTTTVCFYNSVNPAAAIDSHRILDTSGGDATQIPFFLDFYFTLAEGAELPFFEFTENFLISPSNSCVTINYRNFQLFNPGESTASAALPRPSPEADQAVLRLVTELDDSSTLSSSISFRVYRDLEDSLGNTMAEDWSRELFDEDN